MKAPFSYWEKREYKKAFIEKFGKDEWVKMHEGYPHSYIDEDGRHQVKNIVPELHNRPDVYEWIVYEKGWPLAIWQKSVIGETMDIGSNIEHNSAQLAATTKNVAQDVAKFSGRALRLGLLIGGGVLAFVYRNEIKGAIKAAGKISKK